jgi:hypothetical protein
MYATIAIELKNNIFELNHNINSKLVIFSCATTAFSERHDLRISRIQSAPWLIPNTLETTVTLTKDTRCHTMHAWVPRQEMRAAGRHCGLCQECLPVQVASASETLCILGDDSGDAPAKAKTTAWLLNMTLRAGTMLSQRFSRITHICGKHSLS